MKEKRAQENFGAISAMAPTPLSLQTQKGGGGLGGVAYKDQALPLPRGPDSSIIKKLFLSTTKHSTVAYYPPVYLLD